MDTQSNVNSTDDDRHVVATYVSDMLALERHIAAPLTSQLNSDAHKEYPLAMALIRRLSATADRHVEALEAHLQAVGGHAGSPIKSAWASLLGGGAAAINQVRKTKVSKSLRDDSTALGLAAISYTMLNATALGLGDRPTAELAKRHLDDIAPLIVDISRTMPELVLQELREDGENVSLSAAELSEMQTGSSWSSSNTGGSN